MSEQIHPGIHPDADALAAFIEGVLPEHERVQCLTHLAECAHCREIVYLAQVQEPFAAAKAPVPFWRRLFRPMPVTAAIAAAAVVVVSLGLYRMIRSAEPQPQVIADRTAAIEAPPPPKTEATKEKPHLVERKLTPQLPHLERVLPPAAAVPSPSPPQAGAGVDAIQPVPAAPPVQAPDARAPATLAVPGPFAASRFSNAADGAGISGTVTDPAGAVIPKAQIEAKNEATGATYTSTSDTRGQFSIAGLVPGRYDLRVESMGFASYVKPAIDVQPQTIAKVDSTLQVGAMAEAVTVIAASPRLKTETGAAAIARMGPLNRLPVSSARNQGAQPESVYLLPGKHPAVTFAAKDKLVVAADSEGSLFFSDNEGKNWKRVRGKWNGKVVRVISPPDVPGSRNLVFELITDPASTWLSANGRHWSAAPASR
ncbi:MAG TPA: carboxypeptidase regulatory-like domain-containing protein [Bryobacteraceae bacterium]|nr:carboxypeptidase regulatory-like domain-containing protein [Bryobacteraceae bacterium]